MLKKFLSCLFILIFTFALLGGLIAWQSYRFWFQSPDRDAEAQSFSVEEGDRASVIAAHLEAQELIANRFWFQVYLRIDGSARTLQAGSVELQPGMSYAAIADVLSNATSTDVSITIPEGYTRVQIGQVLAETLGISSEDWDAASGTRHPFANHALLVAAKTPAGVDLEGYLFPDTYRVFPDARAEDIVKLMLDTMQSRIAFNEIIVEAGSTDVTSLHDALTVASILEREVRHQEDLGQVSGIIYNRLEIGMPLQMDSTVNYITGKDTPSISLDDRDIISPYNTYQNAGLPPGPISNPGIAAIRAAVNPTSTNYLFFLTTPEGEAIYAKTFDEHVANKNRYLR